MVRFVADGQEIFRVLKETEDGVWVIRYNNPNTPLLLSWPAMSTQMQDVEIPDDFLDESEFSPHIRVPAGRGKGDNMYHLTMTKTQAALIPKAVELYNQVRNKNLSAAVDAYLEACTEAQRREGDPKKAREILRGLSMPNHATGHPISPEYHVEETGDDTRLVTVKSKDDLSEIGSALDFYSRIVMGQWERLTDSFWLSFNEMDAINIMANHARGILIPELAPYPYPSGWGIAHEKNPMASKIAYEMYGCIRYFFWKQRPESQRCDYTVDSRPPLRFSQEPFVKISETRPT